MSRSVPAKFNYCCVLSQHGSVCKTTRNNGIKVGGIPKELSKNTASIKRVMVVAHL